MAIYVVTLLKIVFAVEYSGENVIDNGFLSMLFLKYKQQVSTK